jgi:hypothetical protein
MVRFILISFFVLSYAHADFLGFKTGDTNRSKIPELSEKLKNLEMEKNPAYEENFNQLVKTLETTMEEEKLFCSGEVADSNGKVLGKDQKQLCFRELKGHYLEALDIVFDLKKKYLGFIHNRQVEKLSEIQKKLKSDIEKSF